MSEVRDSKKTPMQIQYEKIKAEYSDSILFFRLGDFYEMFEKDAEIASEILGIVLTQRKNKNGSQKMCGIPFHSSENYINKLVEHGYKVAVAEQVSDPSQKGIVERKVTSVITPATNLSVKNNSDKTLIALDFNQAGIKFLIVNIHSLNLTFGELLQVCDLRELIEKFNVSEIISVNSDNLELNSLVGEFHILHKQIDLKDTEKVLDTELEQLNIELSQKNNFRLIKHYIQIHLGQFVRYFNKAENYKSADRFLMSHKTLKNLEVFYNFDGSQKNSLFTHINRCKTVMGRGKLINRLCNPFSNKLLVEKSLEKISKLIEHNQTQDLSETLKDIKNIPRLIARIETLKATPADLVSLKFSLISALEVCNLDYIKNVFDECKNLDAVLSVVKSLDCLIDQDPKVVLTKGYIFKKECDQELLSLRELLENSQGLMNQMLEELKTKTGISNMKIKYNKVFGYFIEVSKGKMADVPDFFIRRQTLTNCERYTTVELENFEQKINSAESTVVSYEQNMFLDLLKELQLKLGVILEISDYIAEVDLANGMAICALENAFTKPEVTNGAEFCVTEGFHPVVKNILKFGDFIHNDCELNSAKFKVLTGPNMGGKSTFLRQNAIIMLLVSIGSYVPCESAKIGVCDAIFSRVGASDNLSQGQSTFMVEMQETSEILHNASSKSFVIIDELGRGTSSLDGIAIASSVMEFITEEIGCRTLFATHFFEICKRSESLKQTANLKVAVEFDTNNKPVFLRKIVPGSVEKSYGLEVAEMAGMPKTVIEKSKIYLNSEKTESNQATLFEVSKYEKSKPKERLIELKTRKQIGLEKIAKEILEIDTNTMTPIDSLIKLSEIHNAVKKSEESDS